MLSRDQMLAVIADGGSVLLNGVIHNSAAALPTDADLAGGDPAKTAAARSDLIARRAALDAELAKLEPKPELKPEPEPKPAPKPGPAAKAEDR